jgi:hypothetical protein
LRRYFDAATGVPTSVRKVTGHAPQLDRSGRLFVRHGRPGLDGARALLLVVPAQLVSPLVCTTHGAMSHRAAATVRAELLRTHWWPGMAKDVERIVAECIVPQYTVNESVTKPTYFSHFSLLAFSARNFAITTGRRTRRSQHLQMFNSTSR